MRIAASNAGALTEAWTLTTGGAPTGTPAVIGDVVYLTSASQTYCVKVPELTAAAYMLPR